jgi:ribosome-associated translation inhibitor RaiA
MAGVEFDRDLKKRREPLHLVGHRLSELREHETGRDQRATFDRAMDTIDREVTQLKERVTEHP